MNVAQALGRGRRDEAGQYACSAVQLTVIFAVIFAAVCTLFTDELIALFHVGDAETVRYAVVYTRITCGLVIFSYLTVVLTGIYTAQGDSKTPKRTPPRRDRSYPAPATLRSRSAWPRH